MINRILGFAIGAALVVAVMYFLTWGCMCAFEESIWPLTRIFMLLGGGAGAVVIGDILEDL